MGKGNSIRGLSQIHMDTQADGTRLGLAIDRRPLRQKYEEFFGTLLPITVIALHFVYIVLTFFLNKFNAYPELLIISLLFTLRVWRKKLFKLALKRTKVIHSAHYSKVPKKYHDIVDNVHPRETSDGLYYLGTELESGGEVHVNDSTARVHLILFGTTGGGKTEAMLSFFVNFLCQGSGFMIVDGKGDTLLFAKIFQICRAFNRTDDLYYLSFMPIEEGESKTIRQYSNTMNFFVDSTVGECNEIIGGLLPNNSDSGSDIWSGRAATGIESLNEALYWLQGNGYLTLDPDVYRRYFGLEKFAELAFNEDIPEQYRTGLWTLLTSVNYKLPPEQQPTETESQFQYITMQFTQTFNLLAQKYKHVTVTQSPDISMTDIVLRRRILCVCLPSLAQSAQNVRNLGRITVALARNTSAKALGNNVEGSFDEVIKGKPTSALSSYCMCFDEFGAYSVKSASNLPAMLRSLNIVTIFGGQDYRAFESGDEKEAATIFGTCNIKIALKLECDVTYEKFNKILSEETVLVADEYNEDQNTLLTTKYKRGKRARLEKRPVLTMTDLKQQSNGDATVIVESQVARIKWFYAEPYDAPMMRMNSFLEIKAPDHGRKQAMQKGINALHLGFMHYLNGDWKKEFEKIENISNSFVTTSDLKEFTTIKDTVRTQVIDKEEVTPFETVTCSIALFFNKLELLDQKIADKVRKETGLIHGCDDEDLMSQYEVHEDNEGIFKEVFTVPEELEVKEIELQESPEDKALFDKIEQDIEDKQKTLDRLEKESFSSLPEIGLDMKSLEERLTELEGLLLEKSNSSVNNKSKFAQLIAKNLVLDMGVKSNIASVPPARKVNKQISKLKAKKHMQDILKKVSTYDV